MKQDNDKLARGTTTLEIIWGCYWATTEGGTTITTPEIIEGLQHEMKAATPVNPNWEIKFDVSKAIEELILFQQAIGDQIFESKHTLTSKKLF